MLIHFCWLCFLDLGLQDLPPISSIINRDHDMTIRNGMYMIQDVTFIIKWRWRDFTLLKGMNIMRDAPYCFECVLHTFIRTETLHVIFEGQTYSYHTTFHTLRHLRFCMSDLTNIIKKQTVHFTMQTNKLTNMNCITFILKSPGKSLPGNIMKTVRRREIGQIKLPLFVSLKRSSRTDLHNCQSHTAKNQCLCTTIANLSQTVVSSHRSENHTCAVWQFQNSNPYI